MPFRNPLSHNFGLKMTSLLAATLIWLTISKNLQGTMRLHSSVLQESKLDISKLPVNVMRTSDDRLDYRLSPEVVDVTLTGRAVALEKIRDMDITAYVQLVDLIEARAMRKVLVQTPAGITVSKVDPSDIEVRRVPPPQTPSDPNP